MIIENKITKRLLLLMIVINLTNCTTMEPEFKVIGDADILQDIKINIEISREAKYPIYESTLITLYDKGRKYNPQIEHALTYGIYASYKKTYVTVFGFENIDQWANDFIHHLYVYKKNDSVYINYIGRKSDIDEFKNQKGTPVIPLNDFYKKQGITTEEQKEAVNKKFFEFYDPLDIRYKQETQEIQEIEEEKN